MLQGWRDARVDYSARLESDALRKGYEGSNPSPSARNFRQTFMSGGNYLRDENAGLNEVKEAGSSAFVRMSIANYGQKTRDRIPLPPHYLVPLMYIFLWDLYTITLQTI